MEDKTWIDENDERIGEETDEWMDVNEGRNFLDMKTAPGSIAIYLTSKPILQRSKYGGRKQYWFPCKQIVDPQTKATVDGTLSTSSQRLRAGIKRLYEKHGEKLFNGEVLVGINWTGNGMDRSYSVHECVVATE